MTLVQLTIVAEVVDDPTTDLAALLREIDGKQGGLDVRGYHFPGTVHVTRAHGEGRTCERTEHLMETYKRRAIESEADVLRLARQGTATMHKAAPAPEFAEDASSVCVFCHKDIKRVPGGQGMTWVHAESGAVVGHG